MNHCVVKREFSQANFRRFLRNVTARQTSFRSLRQECCRQQTENNEKYFIDMLLLFCCALVVPSCRQKNDNKSRLPSHEAQVAMLKVEIYEIVCLIVSKCSHLMGLGANKCVDDVCSVETAKNKIFISTAGASTWHRFASQRRRH